MLREARPTIAKIGALAAALLAATGTTVAAQDHTLSGRVVVLRTNEPLEHVIVEVMDQARSPRLKTQTKSNGCYELNIPAGMEKFGINYHFPDGSAYGTNAREGVKNDLPLKTLDTIGLADLRNRDISLVHARAAIEGAIAYVRNGGDRSHAQVVLTAAGRQLPGFAETLGQDPRLQDALRQLGLPDRF